MKLLVNIVYGGAIRDIILSAMNATLRHHEIHQKQN